MTNHSRIHFGKHRGKLWADVPAQYLSWIVATFDDGPVRDAAKASLHVQKVAQRQAKWDRKRLGKRNPLSRGKSKRTETADTLGYVPQLDREFASIVTGDRLSSLPSPVDPSLAAPWE